MKNFFKNGILMLCVLGLMAFLFAACENPTGIGDSRAATGPVGINISSAADLALIGTTYPLNGNYDLLANITLTSWTPIAPDSNHAFSGTFNGNGNTITVSSFTPGYSGQYFGIFGYIGGQSTSAQIANLTVNLNAQNIQYINNADSYIGGLAGYIKNAVVSAVNVTGAIGWKGQRIVYLGGIAGAVESTSVEKSNAVNLTITGASGKGTVYVGGVVGYGTNSRLTGCISSGGLVAGNGHGHNTSAGGIAGYVTDGSTVIYSSSVGTTIRLSAPGGSSMSNAYMIYAGGLLGYAGNKSTTSQSYATGTVSASSPYPYAGGLVGYNYGALGAVNGSLISQCYATGTVIATASTGIPYAGGLAGYNSSQDSIIEDSYATGAVTATTTSAYAWAGGIVGSNANNAAVRRCYATGDVSATAGTGTLPTPQPGVDPGALAGGIVGYNYFTTTTAVQYCAALNGTVTGTAPAVTRLFDVNRVAGRNGNGVTIPLLLMNFASTGMTLNPSHSFRANPNGVDGGDCNPVPDNPDWYRDLLKWNFGTVWKQGSGSYPVLQWQP
jgi:hypothetical protein